MNFAIELVDRTARRLGAGLWVKDLFQVSARQAGIPVPDSYAEDAMACCAAGGIELEARRLDHTALISRAKGAAYDALDAVAQDRGFLSIEEFNDAPTTTLDDMLTLLDEAMDRLAKAEPDQVSGLERPTW